MFKFIYKKYNFFIRKHFGGYFDIGKNITIYGHNAMKWQITIRTKKYGCVCFRLPFTVDGKFDKMYIYFSPNGTPWACTYYRGYSKTEYWRSILRKKLLGHNFKVNDENVYRELQFINDCWNIQDYLEKTKRRVMTEKYLKKQFKK